jgi:hypothetical protein
VKILPESRRPALRLELELLNRTIEKLYILPEDIALARISDTQGLGGSSGNDPPGRPVHDVQCRQSDSAGDRGMAQLMPL